jgi:hypothetical protein
VEVCRCPQQQQSFCKLCLLLSAQLPKRQPSHSFLCQQHHHQQQAQQHQQQQTGQAQQ